MDSRIALVALITALNLPACSGKSDDTDAASSTTATTESASSTTESPTGSTTSAPTTTSAETTTTETTAGLECNPAGLAACPVEACVQRWDYECSGCGVEFDPFKCFPISEGCDYPWLTCDLPEPCGRVWAFPEANTGTLEVLESETEAICVLESLRDGLAAQHEIRFGEMGDVGDTVMNVFVDGKGGATFQWTVDCAGCPESGVVGRSGRLALQPAAYFDACLAAPTTASLLECIYGFTSYQEGDGPADGYTPPWTTGMCSALEFVCPTP
jgi:hypothetical protein